MRDKKLLKALRGVKDETPPVWLMRQAGRHLPEYRELRARARDFLDFCYSPSLAAEATLQPVRRYDMDGAILFADILLVLDALGRGVRFLEGEGPRVDPVERGRDLEAVSLSTAMNRLAPIGETVSRVRAELSRDATLIGFAGAPWTVAVYAIEGRGGTDKSLARQFGYRNPSELERILDRLVDVSAHYLHMQVEAGADVVMLFDSWAEGLPEDVFDAWVIEPTRKLISRLRDLGVKVPIIGFPRGSGGMMPEYAERTGADAIGLDSAIPLNWANSVLPLNFPVQGNLDPLRLIEGGEGLDVRIREIIDAFHDRPLIFNLGHGVLPETPISHVERLLEVVREKQ